MTRLLQLLAPAVLALLAACAPPHKKDTPPIIPAIQPGYEAVQDGDFLIPGVETRLFLPGMERSLVPYNGDEAAGTIVVDTFARKLYHVMDGGMAERYAIAVGREGLSFRGEGVIGRKEEWPSWQPTSNMVKTRPDLYAAFAAGLPGGHIDQHFTRSARRHGEWRETQRVEVAALAGFEPERHCGIERLDRKSVV